MKKPKKFKGIMCPLLTPLDGNERILERDLVKLTEKSLRGGVKSLLTPSGTGETFLLSEEECERHVRIVSSAAGDRAFIVSLQISCSTRELLKKFEAAARAGADALMTCPPYFEKYDQKGLYKFFAELARNVSLPLWIYNQPAHTQNSVEPETVLELVREEGIAGVKDSSGADVCHIQKIINCTKEFEDFSVLMGEDVNALCGLVLGADGLTATLANFMPEIFTELYDAVRKKEFKKARLLQEKITKADDVIIGGARRGEWRSGGKYLLKNMGIFSTDICARPGLRAGSSHKKQLDKLAAELGF